MDDLDSLDRFLIGKELKGGWKIVEPYGVQRDHPSYCRAYKAANASGALAFVKILDNTGITNLDLARLEMDRFAYERDIVNKCRLRNMRRVVQGLEYGYIEVPGVIPLVLHYLVFEWAEGDVRSRLDEETLHHAHCLRWLHHATTAIEELHYSEIAHQDVKPANVLIDPNHGALIGDMGRAIDGSIRRRDLESSNDKTRDLTYAAPEVLYGKTLETLDERFAADLYQLGSIAVFLFTNMGMTAHLMLDLPPIHHPRQWRGNFATILPFLAPQFEASMARFEKSVHVDIQAELIPAIRQLCEPDPQKRGNPGYRLSGGPRYGVRQYVSLFDRLATRSEYSMRRAGP